MCWEVCEVGGAASGRCGGSSEELKDRWLGLGSSGCTWWSGLWASGSAVW